MVCECPPRSQRRGTKGSNVRAISLMGAKQAFLIIAKSRCQPPDNMAEEKIIPHKFEGHVCRWSKEPHKARYRFAGRYRGQRWSSVRTSRLKSPRHPLRRQEYQSHQEASDPC